MKFPLIVNLRAFSFEDFILKEYMYGVQRLKEKQNLKNCNFGFTAANLKVVFEGYLVCVLPSPRKR